MTGVTFPVAMSSRMMVRSCLFSFATNVTNFWLTDRDKTGAVSARVRKSQSPFAPATTHTPLGFKARLCADNEWFKAVENQVVTLPTFGEILLDIINDTICADGSHHLHISRAAYAGHIRAERLGDLHRERTHASRRPVNQEPFAPAECVPCCPSRLNE